MRRLVTVLVLGLGVVGFAASALAIDRNDQPPGLVKFSRGAVNVAVGLPDEVISHVAGSVTESGEDTLGGFVDSAITGVLVGTFWGVARVGSGIVDVFTFPVPFDEDNSPLVEPDHHI
jgi:putative exosortase-associated protein (TIGR04073 family)